MPGKWTVSTLAESVPVVASSAPPLGEPSKSRRAAIDIARLSLRYWDSPS